MQQISVRVPASTSNLGPGFDCLGVALRVYNTVTIRRDGSRDHLHPPIVCEAADRFFEESRHSTFKFSCLTTEQIPRSRGLGSSATIRLGTLFGLNRLTGNSLDRLTIFRLCAQLEGHPDNAAPATFGGFTVAIQPGSCADWLSQRSVVGVQRFPVSPRLCFVLFIPKIEIATSAARRILPANIPRFAAIENCANACAVTSAFVSQKYEYLRGVFHDHLHQPFRAKLIPFLPRVIAAAEEAGALGAFLSGSGSAIAAVTLQSSKKIAAAMIRAARSPGSIIITQADNRGAHILPMGNRQSVIGN